MLNIFKIWYFSPSINEMNSPLKRPSPCSPLNDPFIFFNQMSNISSNGSEKRCSLVLNQ
jgi:hypothetical protein